MSSRVFTIPPSAPFLPTLIAAMTGGKIGFQLAGDRGTVGAMLRRGGNQAGNGRGAGKEAPRREQDGQPGGKDCREAAAEKP